MIVITVTTKGGSEPDLYKLDTDRIRIGREPDNDVVLPSKTCSRYHAEIQRSHDTYKIVDCGSTNGIKIGPEKLPEVLITHGISVGIGEYTLTFDLSDQQVAKTIRIPVGTAAPSAPVAEDPAAPPPVLFLVYRARSQVQSLKVVAGVEYLIGRSPGSDLVLDDRNVSGQHARISYRDQSFIITDLDSANGTQVNHKRVREAPLRADDSLTIGDTMIAVKAERDDLADEALLLARTQLKIPQQQAQETGLAPSGSRVGLYATVIAVFLLVVIVGLVLLTRNDDRSSADDQPGPSLTAAPGSSGAGEAVVQVATITAKEIVAGVSGAGTVKPQQSVTISAEVAGRVVEMPVSEGEVVSRGQLLARLDDRDLRLRIEEVRSAVSQEQVELARQDYLRKERLFNEGAVTRSIYDQAKGTFLKLDSAYRSNQARLRQLQEQVAKTKLTAASSGTVARKLISRGELVAPGVPVLVIESMDEVLIELEVADRDIVKVRPLQTVEATTDAFPGRVFPGAVEHIGAAANPITKGFKVEARIGNQDGLLRSGMIASITVILEKRNGLVVPLEALRERLGDQAEVLVVADGVARKVRVSLGQQMDREVELLHGLSEGDEVIVYGHESVTDGQPVKVYD